MVTLNHDLTTARDTMQLPCFDHVEWLGNELLADSRKCTREYLIKNDRVFKHFYVTQPQDVFLLDSSDSTMSIVDVLHCEIIGSKPKTRTRCLGPSLLDLARWQPQKA
jgi:hypothetical protein